MKARGFRDRSSVRSRAVAFVAALCVWLVSARFAVGQPDSEVSAALSGVTATPASGALADGIEEVTIEVIVRDAQGEPLPEHIVRVSSSNPADMIAQPVAPTDAQGRTIATMVTEIEGVRVLWATVDTDGDEVELEQEPFVYFEAPPVRPNVIVILIDDVGTDSLSMFDEVNPYRADLPYDHDAPPGIGDDPANGVSNLYAYTPNLEYLADHGVTFLNAYAMPVCSPSRACLFTGNYPVRTGMGGICRLDNTGGTLNEFGDFGFEHTTLAQLATSANYADVLVGKWHLGQQTSDMVPPTPGLPPWTNFLGWSTIPDRGHFTEWTCVFGNITTPRPPSGTSGIYRYYLSHNTTDHTTVPIIDGPYITTVLFDEALDWCTTQTQPFLCVITPTSAHSPWHELPPQSPQSTDEYYPTPEHNAWHGYMAQVETLDTEIGNLLNGLPTTVREDTLFIVIGDNGIEDVCLEHARTVGPTPDGPDGSGKVLGETYDFLLDACHQRFKSSTYEKGIRVPMIVSGFGVSSPGRESTALVDVTDVFPTVAELLGQPLSSPVHGVSFLPILQGQATYLTHERNYTYAETFGPLGSTGPDIPLGHRGLGCSLIIPGQGRYKIVFDQEWDETIDLCPDEDEFYKLQDANGDFLDPFETVALPHGPSDPEYANYTLVLAKMNEIIASGASSGPQTCPSSTNFCMSDANSTGQPAVMSDSGPCSVLLNRYTLRAEPVPNQFGIFFYSDGIPSTPIPFGNGFRCVGGAGHSIFRLSITMAANNALEYPLDLTDLPTNGDILPHSTWNFQAWYRDPAAGGANFDFSDGLQITFGS